jgi:hypothetical protein
MLRITPQADLGVFFDADNDRYLQRHPGRAAPLLEKEAFISHYAGCPSIGFECDGQPIGGVIFDGQQAHIAVLPDYHGRWGLLLKPACDWLFGLRREVFVRVESDNVKSRRMMDRCGWQRVGTEGEDLIYRMAPQRGLRKAPYPWTSRRQGAAQSSGA